MAAEVDHLIHLASGDTESARWLAGVIRGLQLGSSWTEASGITARQVARGIRDRHIRRARGMVSSTQELFRQANRFESIVWPRWRLLDSPPETASALHEALFLARKSCEFPGTIRQLNRILGHKPMK